MAALIPAIGTCVSNMTGGERRLAYRLEQKLEDDWLRCFYNDAQSIYGRDKRGKISFKSLGIQAQGRTTILKINYRNTQEVLELASDLLKPNASDEDGIPPVTPISVRRHGPKPLAIKLPTQQEEADYIAQHLKEAYQDGINFAEKEDAVKFLSMHSCKGLEFPMVATPGVGRSNVNEGRKDEEARLLYVAMPRAIQQLVVAAR